MKKLLYHILLLLSSTGLFGQATISLNTPRTAGGTETACQSISLKPGFSFKATTAAGLTLSVNPTTCDPFAGAASSVSSSQNYIQTRTYTTGDGSRYMESIQYFDGLGRPVQAVQRGITPNTADLVTYQEYDAHGRKDRTWLPAAIKGNNGAYVALPTMKPQAIAVNGNDQEPYSYPVYEVSPLNRIREQYGEGANWHKNSKSVRTEYLVNNADIPCAYYYVSGDNCIRSNNYSNGQLYVTKITDEDGNISYEFKDKLGQVVLSRQINEGQNHDTYYVYDYYGNLRFVFPPMATDLLTANKTYTLTENALVRYAYLYKYDDRNRCIWKKLPGCDPIYYIYDKADRLIFSQDGEQRKKSEWMFSIPDASGRIVLTGTCKNTLDYAVKPLKTAVVKATWAKATNTYKGYTITGVTLTSPGILSVNYYDHYEFMGLNSIPANTNTDYIYTAESGYGVWHGTNYTETNRYKNKGLLTGSIVAQQLAGGTISATYLYSIMYYDNRNRLIQTKSNNHLSGGIEKEYIAYNFTGQPIKKKHVHQATGKTTQTEVYTYTYDHAGRQTKTTHQFNGGTTVTLAENTYDELGRLKTNKRGGVTNTLSTYSYNVRSWTKSIISPLFEEVLNYDGGQMDTKGLYNGNISSMNWKFSGDPIHQGYNFVYDNLSRIKAAKYWVGGSYRDNYNVSSITYDKHGNIKTLQRYGKTTASAYGLIDNLTMTYTGNQLLTANDAVANISLAESADFKNYSNVATEYTYNTNGAMNKDLNKGITAIQYNSLNLPRMMDIKSPVAEARNEYTYTATGAKLKVVQKWNPSFSTAPVIGSAINTAALTLTKTTDYVGNIIYENSALKRILIDGGYIEAGVYYYYLTDHLGNNRVVVNTSGTAVQRNHYYPFGMSFADTPMAEQGKQPYKYNGKELDQMHGLNLYDYSARFKDDFRFITVDPLAEKYPHISPYAYVENNPLKYIDPTGKEKLNGMGKRDSGGDLQRSRDKVDNDMIHIYGHGSSNGLTFVDIRGNVSIIKNASDLQSLLTRYSAIWNNRLPGEELIIVLHSCNTGSIMDRGAITLAENISVDMPNVVIVAPSDYLYISSAREIVTSEDQTKYGSWIYYREGIPIYSEEGNKDNNPDLKHYNRPLYSKGNTKEEQRAKRDEGLNQEQQKPKNYDNWSKTRQWFYDTFGID